MNKQNKIIEYSIQLAMLKTLYKRKVLTEEQYKLIKKTLMADYHVPFVEHD